MVGACVGVLPKRLGYFVDMEAKPNTMIRERKVTMKDRNAMKLGRKGGLSKSQAKRIAAQTNGAKGGRPKIKKDLVDIPKRLG